MLAFALLCGAPLLVVACEKPTAAGSHVAPSGAPSPAPSGTPAGAPGGVAQGAALLFVAVPGWKGPAARAAIDATQKLVLHLTAPTAGYEATLDDVVVAGDAATVKVTLLQPASDVVVAQVVTDVMLAVDAGKLGGKAKATVSVRQMQKNAQYFVAPPWEPALTGAAAGGK